MFFPGPSASSSLNEAASNQQSPLSRPLRYAMLLPFIAIFQYPIMTAFVFACFQISNDINALFNITREASYFYATFAVLVTVMLLTVVIKLDWFRWLMNTWTMWIVEQITRIWLLAFFPDFLTVVFPYFFSSGMPPIFSQMCIGAGVATSITDLVFRFLHQRRKSSLASNNDSVIS